MPEKRERTVSITRAHLEAVDVRDEVNVVEMDKCTKKSTTAQSGLDPPQSSQVGRQRL